jgi:hypothetical protein
MRTIEPPFCPGVNITMIPGGDGPILPRGRKQRVGDDAGRRGQLWWPGDFNTSAYTPDVIYASMEANLIISICRFVDYGEFYTCRCRGMCRYYGQHYIYGFVQVRGRYHSVEVYLSDDECVYHKCVYYHSHDFHLINETKCIETLFIGIIQAGYITLAQQMVAVVPTVVPTLVSERNGIRDMRGNRRDIRDIRDRVMWKSFGAGRDMILWVKTQFNLEFDDNDFIIHIIDRMSYSSINDENIVDIVEIYQLDRLGILESMQSQLRNRTTVINDCEYLHTLVRALEN